MDPLSIALILIVAGGVVWIVVAASRRRPHQSPEQAEKAEHANRVTQIAKWEAAYSELHPGEPIPAMPAHFAGVSSAGLSQQTNMMAILSIIFGIGGGLLGIVFGHLAHAQIRRTGERGWGLATAGLIFGYIGLAALIAVVVASIVLTVGR